MHSLKKVRSDQKIQVKWTAVADTVSRPSSHPVFPSVVLKFLVLIAGMTAQNKVANENTGGIVLSKSPENFLKIAGTCSWPCFFPNSGEMAAVVWRKRVTAYP